VATRLERVVLELDDNLSSGMVKAAAATALLKRELDSMGGSARGAERDTEQLGKSSDRAGASIDRLSGRMVLIAHSIAALGPALVPIVGVAIPAIVGLASELGFAAVGAGTTALAFHGLGDALTKFNKASLDPTATNIKNAQIAMDKIPSSAQRFVLELHRMTPAMDELRRAAGDNLFPGLTEGLHALSADMPIAKRALSDVSHELGILGARAGHSLSSDKWTPFLHFIDQEAPRAIDDLGTTVGSLTHGLAELWMAFTPLNQGFSSGLVHLAADFDRWATSLGRTKGFEDFVAYIAGERPEGALPARRDGPDVRRHRAAPRPRWAGRRWTPSI
jgi:hypothetical protein